MTKHQSTAVRRAQIMEAAGKLIIRQGSEHLTVKGIASEVGISEAAIYRHFRSKKEILLFLLDAVRDNLLAEYRSPDLENNASLGALQAALFNHLNAISRRGGVSFQVIAEVISLGDRELNTHASMALSLFTERLRKLLEGARNCGRLRPDLDIESTAVAISAIIQGLVNTWVLSDYQFDLKANFTRVWQTVTRGFSALSSDTEYPEGQPCA